METATKRSPRSADEEAVLALFSQMMEGWNGGSGEAFGAPFAEEVDFIGFDGAYVSAKAQMALDHQELFDRWLRGSRLTGEASVRFLTGDVALVLGRGGTVLRGRARPAPERDSIQTLVAVRGGDGWKLTSFHNTRVRPMGDRVTGALLWLVTDRLWRVFVRRTAGSTT